MFWGNFVLLCDINGIKPNKVCKDLGFSSATSTHWKNGKIPKIDKVQKIADYFNVSTDWLLTGENKDGTGGMMVSVDKDALMDAISKVKSEIAENATHVVEIPSDVIDSPVAFAVSADSDEELKSKIKQIIDGMSEEKLKEVLPYAEYVRDKK